MKKKKGHGCLTALLIFVALIVIVVIAIKVSNDKAKKEREQSYFQITWPTTGLGARLPQPENLYGEIEMEREDYIAITIAKSSKAEFNGQIVK